MALFYQFNKPKETLNVIPYSYGDEKVPEYIAKYSIEEYNYAIAKLIVEICKEKFFTELRTNEALGYEVSVGIYDSRMPQYISFAVESKKQ